MAELHKVVEDYGAQSGFPLPPHGIESRLFSNISYSQQEKLVIWLKFTSANEALLPSYREGNV